MKTHVGRVLAKIGAPDRIQAVILAYDLRLTRPADVALHLARPSWATVVPAAPLRADPLRVIDRSAAGSACGRPRHRPSDRHDAARA